ncbi:hypothetical protein RCL_jg1071.t2 [Rhizophagus clarus]|uniref:Uncharacterized protein n=1 Tax=Rhizophagus clarus TaxID=94130 RepID=A0A8H3MA08_9GLOM|nr:hypothetical protein RCL_jg1071.t2 [Rhizophagus clarus]
MIVVNTQFLGYCQNNDFIEAITRFYLIFFFILTYRPPRLIVFQYTQIIVPVAAVKFHQGTVSEYGETKKKKEKKMEVHLIERIQGNIHLILKKRSLDQYLENRYVTILDIVIV